MREIESFRLFRAWCKNCKHITVWLLFEGKLICTGCGKQTARRWDMAGRKTEHKVRRCGRRRGMMYIPPYLEKKYRRRLKELGRELDVKVE